MILRLIRWLLHKFNYELIHLGDLLLLNAEHLHLIDIARGAYCNMTFDCVYDNNSFIVVTTLGDYPEIIIKRFKIKDYGSEAYARACAQELCDKLNEKP